MKKQVIAGWVLALLVAGGTVQADNEWGVFGSVWSPADGATGSGGGIKAGLEMVDRVQLDIRYSVVNNLEDGDVFRDLDVQPLEFGLAFSIPVSPSFEPYIGVGLGYYFFDADPGVDDEWGFTTSLGAEWILSRSGASYGETVTALFVEGMYRTVEPDGIDLSGFGAQAGLLIGW
jgi:hypothetical protein